MYSVYASEALLRKMETTKDIRNSEGYVPVKSAKKANFYSVLMGTLTPHRD
jgi:hypothetical protein